MTRLDECISGTAREMGLDEKDVRDIAERLERFKKRKIAEGRTDRLDDDVRTFAKTEAERVKLKAALKRKQAAINVLLNDEWHQELTARQTGGLSRAESILSMLVGGYQSVKGERASAQGVRQGLESEWLGGLSAAIQKDLPHLASMMNDPKSVTPFANDVVREWRKPGSTGNKDARAMAEIFQKYGEASRLEANRVGANIGRIDDWGGPQRYDSAALMKAGKDRFVARMLDELDIDRSFGEGFDPAKAAEIVGDSFDTITTGRSNRTTAKGRGERVGPSNLADSLAEHRVFHYNDADAWIRINEEFGDGNVITGMLDHLHSMARTVSVMNKLGPNPQVFLDAQLERQRDAVKKGPGTEAAKRKELDSLRADLNSPLGGDIALAFLEVSGHTHQKGNMTMATVGANIRAVESMAKLGGAAISSISDLATYGSRLRYQGRGLLHGYMEGLVGILDQGGAKDRHLISLLMGTGHETFLGSLHGRFGEAEAFSGRISRWQNSFFKWSGLTWWTDKLTDSFSAMASVDMAHKRDLPFDQLDGAYQKVLGLHNIDAKRWELVRQLSAQQGSYTYIHPELAKDLPDEAFHGLMDKPTPRKIEKARRDLELDLRSYFVDEAGFGVMRGDDRTRMFTLHGTQAGTKLGEAFRFFMQFKSFPIAYYQKMLKPTIRRAFKPGPNEQRDAFGLAALIGMSTVLGYGAMTIKDYAKNKTLRDPNSVKTWLAAAVQGGGAGIYGDFLFAKRDRMGGGVLGSLAGPMFGNLDSVVGIGQDLAAGSAIDGPRKAGRQAAADTFNLALNNTPMINLWYTRAALDLAVLNWMQNAVSPGVVKRREQTMRRDYGQRYIIDPTAHSIPVALGASK